MSEEKSTPPPRLSPAEQKTKTTNQFLRWFIAVIKNSGGKIVLEKAVIDSVNNTDRLSVLPDEKAGTVTIEVFDQIDLAQMK